MDQLTKDIQACQHGLLLCEQELDHSRRECSDMYGRAQHAEVEIENQRNALRKTSEFTAMIHSLSGESLLQATPIKVLIGR